ncbi:MAG TPA: hypothetical protein VKA23_06090 [Mariprofundaceae bacterium]|nr:hypothetical protein [Mariprofundaceae bacterium]
MEKEILDINDISELIGRSPKAIRIAMSRNQEGITVPPSTKIGSRRVWMREVVDTWLQGITAKTLEEYEAKKYAHNNNYVHFVSLCFILMRHALNGLIRFSLKKDFSMPVWQMKNSYEV